MALSAARKASIRSKLKTKIQSAGYKKGHVSKTTDKKISDVKPVKKKAPTDLKAKFKGKTDSAGYKKAVQARKHAQKAKKVMFKKPESGAKSTAQKAFKAGAVKGKQVSHAKSVHKDWRTKAMKKAKTLTGTAKRDAMRKVDSDYRKKIGVKQKKYT
jgi:hypothetical protein